MIETARVLSAALAVMFAIAAATKLTRPRGGWTRIVEHVAGARTASAAAVVMPVAEAAIVVALVVWPQLGLRAAGVLLVGLALGVARAVRSGLTGARCSCLGGFTRSRIGLPLAAADGVLAVAALGASLAPGALGDALSVGQLLAGAAAFTAVMLVLRIPSPPRLRTGRRLRGLVGAEGRSMVVVVVSPGCPPCERLAPELRSFAAGRSDFEVVVVIGPGPAAQRERMARVVGGSSRLDLERLPHRWRVPATPWGIAIGGDGRISGNGPAPTIGALAELVARPPPTASPQRRQSPAPEGLLDRRSLLRAFGAASIMLPSLGAVAAVARTVARAATSNAGTVTQENLPVNTFHGTCARFSDFVATTGIAYYSVNDNRLYNLTDVGGVTQTEGDTTPPSIPVSVIDRHDTWSNEQGGYCGCTQTYYPSYTLCTIACPTGLECFGYQCQPTGPSRWCLTSDYGIAFDAVNVQKDVLVWDPPADASNACKAYAAGLNSQFSTHEDRHVADALNALADANRKNRHLTSSACAPTQAEALQMVNAQIAANEQTAEAGAIDALDAASTAFHHSPAGQPAHLVCSACDQETKPITIHLR